MVAAALAPPPDLRAELADLQRQRPALVAAVHTTEETARVAVDALEAARAAADRAQVSARDARRWADKAVDRLRAHDAALREVQADLTAHERS